MAKKKFRVAIDAGHGFHTPGKRIPKYLRDEAYGGDDMDDRYYREHTLNRQVALLLGQRLTEEGYEILYVFDTTGEIDTPLTTRCNTANKFNADLFISIHHNAGIDGRKGGGTMVYHYPSTKRAQQGKALYNLLIKYNNLRGNRVSPVVASNSLYVLKHTVAPAFLCELGFMDAPDDLPIITQPAWPSKNAYAILDFVKEFERGGV